jgi:hypothetical protein
MFGLENTFLDDIWDKTGGQVFGDAQHDDSKFTEQQFDDNRWALGGDAGYADQQAANFNNQAAQMGRRGTGANIADVDGPHGGAGGMAPRTSLGANGFSSGFAGPGRIAMGNGNVGGFAQGNNASSAPKTNYLGNEMDSRGEQMFGLGQMRQNLQMARDAAMGKAPSVAEEQLRYGNDLNNASIQSQAASARGPGGLAMAQMNAQAQMANGNQSTNANQAILRAQEMANARSQLYGVTDSYGQQASGLRGLDQSIINSGRNFNIQKGQLSNQGRQIDDNAAMGMYGLGSQYSQAGLQGRMNVDQARAGEAGRVQAARSAQSRYNNAQDAEKNGRLMGVIGSVAPAVTGMVGGLIPGGIPGMGGMGGGAPGGGSAQPVGGSQSNPFGGHEHGKGYTYNTTED